MTYRILSHTADSGIEATAPTLPDLIAVLAQGMFDLMAPVEPGEGAEQVEIEVTSGSVEDLVVDVLSDLLFESESTDLLFGDFVVAMTGATGARVAARGVPISKTGMIGPPIKAVTYHDLAVEERDDGWYGRVIFDV